MPFDSFGRDRSVLVTGATGFLGSHLVAALVRRGAAVLIVRRDRRPATPVSAGWLEDVAVVHGDVVDTALMQRVLEEFSVQTVLHAAAQTQVGVAHSLDQALLDTVDYYRELVVGSRRYDVATGQA
jgi:CDP-glucose 4,6-dehydratase